MVPVRCDSEQPPSGDSIVPPLMSVVSTTVPAGVTPAVLVSFTASFVSIVTDAVSLAAGSPWMLAVLT